MTKTVEMQETLRRLFESQSLAVLATHRDGAPHATLVAFAATSDLKHLVFATNRETRKYANISSDARVSLLVDNRSNRPSDFREAVAVTAAGNAFEVEPAMMEDFRRLYLEKHPYLEEFVDQPTCALIASRIEVYYLVGRFQHVMELRVKE